MGIYTVINTAQLKKGTVFEMDKILDLLAEISRKLDRLGNAPATAAQPPLNGLVVGKAAAARLAGVHANTITNWAREFSGLHVGKNQYSVAKLREIIALKKA